MKNYCQQAFVVLSNYWELLPIRCKPLTFTGPVPAFSRMVTGAFSSNSPRLTWGEESTGKEVSNLSLFHVASVSVLSLFTTSHSTMGRQPMWRLAMGTEIVFPWWFMAVTSTTLLSSFAPSPKQTCRNYIFMSIYCCQTVQWKIFLNEMSEYYGFMVMWWDQMCVATVHTVLSSRKCSRSSSSSPWKV